MRIALFLALAVTAGCGARTALVVAEASEPDASVVTPPRDSGADSAPDGTHAVDSGPDVVMISPLDSGVDSSSQTVKCIWRPAGNVGIGQVACPGGSACIPEQGCVPPNEIPAGTATTACGVLACSNECMCRAQPFVACDCGNIP